ncbi:outer membrane protein assembly factor BamE [Acetobacteraceae bacterium H6797]|nr:outer membrane protein assembly factor BamE [Acetobacteraceae bacterium H6797]
MFSSSTPEPSSDASKQAAAADPVYEEPGFFERLFSAPPENRGIKVDADALNQLTPGVQTKADVIALLGSPTTTSVFGEEHWYYISGITRTQPGRFPSLENQRVVMLRFDGGGVLREVKRINQDQARDVEVVSRETPSPGTERTLFQALFGNIGRVGAAGTIGDSSQGPGGGPGR